MEKKSGFKIISPVLGCIWKNTAKLEVTRDWKFGKLFDRRTLEGTILRRQIYLSVVEDLPLPKIWTAELAGQNIDGRANVRPILKRAATLAARPAVK
ncbi:hypothetical protein BpHYR1_004469 [Brachionus plicatilis]|uniref:Uncharacterized protein n=1 Tax=Brachionus plicatilis TaxID=10195 RepID=A0A3M7S9L8_BRAPC|nr:hypothetical protein BpHYR1_004469 [Brachionus plicatilis]